MTNEVYDDNTLMPFGKKYEGTPLGEIPAEYFLWLQSQDWIKATKYAALRAYIADNMDCFEKEQKEKTWESDY